MQAAIEPFACSEMKNGCPCGIGYNKKSIKNNQSQANPKPGITENIGSFINNKLINGSNAKKHQRKRIYNREIIIGMKDSPGY